MATQLRLKFDIQSDWHVGSGEEGGAYADALVLKNENDLPYLPGRSIKGLLREAMSVAQDNNHNDNQHNTWFSEVTIDAVFGSEGDGESTQGMLLVNSAQLSDGEQAFLVHNPQAKSHLYRIIHSTAIDHESGVAKKTSLRSIEVSIPMTLFADITINTDNSNAVNAIERTLPLITHLGAKRHRGLGAVFVTVEAKGVI